ncbi:MAG: glycogen/starch synthase [Candidatus Gastranaerophilales bacterium]|nr:glycogen/starch synthase [Candidatus Gastranaerophilales bacterium]
MRVDAVKSQDFTNKVAKSLPLKGSKSFHPNVISLSQYMSRPVSFTGSRNKEQVIFIGAESDPYSKAGGVGTVMKDYRSFTTSENEVEIIPYYGAQKDENNNMSPLKDEDGDYIMHTNKGDIKLELVTQKQMQWGKCTDEKIMLFRIKGEKEKQTYFVYTDATASMNKPYANGYAYRSGAKAKNNGWWGDPYAEFSKASVELLPDVIRDKGQDFDPATIVCSDSQTAFVVEYMAQKSADGNEDYTGIKPTYVGHNMGPGYCGETSMQNMFVDLGATPEQIEKIEQDPMYTQGLLGDEYFKPFVKNALDETGTASAVMIPIYYAKKERANGEGYVKALTVVAEEYAKSLAENPQSAHNIHDNLKQLYDEGSFHGILNPLNDTSINAAKKLPNERYNEDCKDKDTIVLFNGENGKQSDEEPVIGKNAAVIPGGSYPAFKIYPDNPTYEEMREVKNYNKANLLHRLSASDTTIISGNPNKTVKVNPEAKGVYDGPVIRQDLIEKIQYQGKGDEVPLFVSWGRADTQKGFDITLDAFEKFAKTEEGKNAILIIGAGLDGSDESKKIEAKITNMLKDPDLQGRVVHIDGWAPAYAMASAADAAVFPSRFEPCGLTDLEAMKYYCTPIVANTQGLAQKNFDPRIESEAEKATSYKTTHEFNLLKSQVEPIIKAYAYGDKNALEAVKKEFSIFADGDSYDSSLFEDFAKKYSEFIKEKKNSGEELPDNWDDWDELSKQYDFKYKGFARDLKDGILSAELTEAMKSSVSADNNTKKTIFTNLKNLETGWKTNGNLHPDGKSSYEAYRTLHLQPDYSAPVQEDVLAVSDEDIKTTIENRQSKDLTDRLKAYAAGALTGIGAVLIGKIGKAGRADIDNKIQEMAEASKRDASKIKELEERIARLIKTNRKNLIITGILSAAGAALVTFGLMKKFGKKDEILTQDTFVKSEPPVIIPELPSSNTVYLTPSFNDFKGALEYSKKGA